MSLLTLQIHLFSLRCLFSACSDGFSTLGVVVATPPHRFSFFPRLFCLFQKHPCVYFRLIVMGRQVYEPPKNCFGSNLKHLFPKRSLLTCSLSVHFLSTKKTTSLDLWFHPPSIGTIQACKLSIFFWQLQPASRSNHRAP